MRAEKLRTEKYTELADRIGELAAEEAEKKEAQADIYNESACMLYRQDADFAIKQHEHRKTERHTPEYNKETNTCTETIEYFDCDKIKRTGSKGCKKWKKTPTSTKTVTHACDECDCGKGKSSSCTQKQTEE